MQSTVAVTKKKWIKINRSLQIEITKGLLILLFVYTAGSKILDFDTFRVVLTGSPWIGSNAYYLSFAIPTIELLITALLIVDFTKLAGLYASAALMAVFSVYVLGMLLFVPNKPCSCGGIISAMTWGQHLVFNIVFTFLAFRGALLERRERRDRKLHQGNQ